MTKTELKKAINAALPKGWRLAFINMKHKAFMVTCPIGDRFDVARGTYNRKIRRIEKAANADCDGGEFLVGGDTYENFFYLKG